MSISDMTKIPRATVIRKCKFLLKNSYVETNEKTTFFISKNNELIIPYQREFFKKKAYFLSQMLNLIAIS